jgi:GNAT superfamily N-acetyltransferase
MRLREAKPGEAIEVSRVHVRSWQVAYRGLLPDECLDGLRPEDRAQRYTFGDPDPDRPATIVATQQGEIRGFATTGPSRDDDRRGSGELFALYVDPVRWGHGIGRALVHAARARLARQGFTSARTVDPAWQRARGSLLPDGRLGPRRDPRREDVWGIDVESLRYRRPLP